MMTDLDQTVDRILIQIKAADNSAQYLYAHKLYNHQDIRWNYRSPPVLRFPALPPSRSLCSLSRAV
jgi:hypothetical protein